MAFNAGAAAQTYMQNLFNANGPEWTTYLRTRVQLLSYVQDFENTVGSTIDVLLYGTGKVLRKPQMMAKLTVAAVIELFKMQSDPHSR